ncbi:acyl-CoA carboxylase epsilon subunit [Streptomyces sp. NPDC126499]|uniref:acyl-CoA carboxylase epsilon subunit n=1 Tax=Streptomyces sp. NPDC126499 TaxID=3155314 RepID=UPI0033318B5C
MPPSMEPTDPANTVNPANPASTFLRIEKGSPDAAELAALTAVLLARTAALAETPPAADETAEHAPVRRTARWRRLERRTRTGTPRSWRDDARR